MSSWFFGWEWPVSGGRRTGKDKGTDLFEFRAELGGLSTRVRRLGSVLKLLELRLSHRHHLDRPLPLPGERIKVVLAVSDQHAVSSRALNDTKRSLPRSRDEPVQRCQVVVPHARETRVAELIRVRLWFSSDSLELVLRCVRFLWRQGRFLERDAGSELPVDL
jgi:hypothetical protein